MKPLLIMLLASNLLCGCAHRSEPVATQVAVTAILPHQAQTVDWGHSGRAGAAQRQLDWVHVLAKKPLNHDMDQRDHLPSLVHSEPVSELVTEPIPELVTEPISELVTEPIPELVTEPISELVTEPISELVTEPISELVTEPISELVTEPQQAYSHYELERWQRYCNQGKDMDRRDREFVRQEGYRVPEPMARDCQLPLLKTYDNH